MLTKLINPSKFSPINYFSFGIYRIRPPLTPYQQELIAYKRLVREYRLKNIKAYWDRQTQIENDFLGFISKIIIINNIFFQDKYDKQQEKKRLDGLLRFRTSIAKISHATKRNLVYYMNLIAYKTSIYYYYLSVYIVYLCIMSIFFHVR